MKFLINFGAVNLIMSESLGNFAGHYKVLIHGTRVMSRLFAVGGKISTVDARQVHFVLGEAGKYQTW